MLTEDPLADLPTSTTMQPLERDIVFDNLSFQYSRVKTRGTEEEVAGSGDSEQHSNKRVIALRSLNLRFPAGSTTGLVGMLWGFYHPSQCVGIHSNAFVLYLIFQHRKEWSWEIVADFNVAPSL